MIIQETVQYLEENHADLLSCLSVSRIVIGVFFTAVQLSSGDCGLAKTELALNDSCETVRQRDTGMFSPGRLRNQLVREILRCQNEQPLLNSVKIAVLNAVSTRLRSQRTVSVVAGRDPVEWVNTSAGQTITLVGAFQSYIARLSQCPCALHILELNPQAIPEKHRHLYVPASHAAEIIPRSHTVLLTGSTLVIQTLDNLLALISPGTLVALVGPSGGLLPQALFRRGIHIIGTIRVLDPETMFTVVSEGGAGYHLFGTCAEKICLLPA